MTTTPARNGTYAIEREARSSPAVRAFAASQQRTILAALDEASEHKRDLAANCADCADQTCGTCDFRLQAAREYDAVSQQIQSQLYGAPEIEAEP